MDDIPYDLANPTIGPEGLAEDLSCPACHYNLRGLTQPRCPECGNAFDYAELLAAANERPPAFPRSVTMPFVTTVAVIATLLIITPLPRGMNDVVLLAGSLFAADAIILAAIQSIVEMAILGKPPAAFRGGRFAAWMQGTLIGYGLVGVTMMILGYAIVPFETAASFQRLEAHWPRMLVALIEVIAVQFWVLRRRSREWNVGDGVSDGDHHSDGDRLSNGKLVMACLISKTVSGVLWATFMPFALVAWGACGIRN